ncbi:hypothetical protein ACIRRA_30220 [Nocardia sp. NPDC101769]|uniref:hypothetical protein n=1 Tax=Nocardia sp. NPDC101769 TaxID=3364333 RepID=UPI0038021198
MPSHPSLRAGRTATATLLAVTAAGTLTATALAYVDNHASLQSGGSATQSVTPDATAASGGTPANATTAPTPALRSGTGRVHAGSSGS